MLLLRFTAVCTSSRLQHTKARRKSDFDDGDPSDLNLSGECQHCHNTHCDRCECVNMTLEEIPQKLDEVDITEDQRARIKFQNKESV